MSTLWLSGGLIALVGLAGLLGLLGLRSPRAAAREPAAEGDPFARYPVMNQRPVPRAGRHQCADGVPRARRPAEEQLPAPAPAPTGAAQPATVPFAAASSGRPPHGGSARPPAARAYASPETERVRHRRGRDGAFRYRLGPVDRVRLWLGGRR